MKLDEVQCALFAAFDIRNAMTEAERRKRTDNDSYGESLDLIIEFLEALEAEMEEPQNEDV
jgi:hypothetical protein